VPRELNPEFFNVTAEDEAATVIIGEAEASL
jgi:hypothetical protein